MKKLSEQSRHTLRGFLHTELQLAPTLIELARTHSTGGFLKAALESLKRAGDALRVVERFSKRLPVEERPALLQAVAELRAEIETAQKAI